MRHFREIVIGMKQSATPKDQLASPIPPPGAGVKPIPDFEAPTGVSDREIDGAQAINTSTVRGFHKPVAESFGGAIPLPCLPKRTATYWDNNLELLMNSLTEARELAREHRDCSRVRNDLNSLRAFISIYIRTGRVDRRLVSDCLMRLRMSTSAGPADRLVGDCRNPVASLGDMTNGHLRGDTGT